VDDPLDGLIDGYHGAKQDDEHHHHPRQVLHPPVAVGEAPARAEARQREGDPQRHGGRRVPEVVDGIGEKSDRAREHDHNDLHKGRGEEPHEGPLHGPDAALGGRYGGIYRSVRVPVTPLVVVVVVVVVVSMLVCHANDSTADLALSTPVRGR